MLLVASWRAAASSCAAAGSAAVSVDLPRFAGNFAARACRLSRNLRAWTNVKVVTDRQARRRPCSKCWAKTRDKSVLSLNSQGRVREYMLRTALSFRVRDTAPAELLAPTELRDPRASRFNESQVLAKEAEEALLYRDMQTDLVQQMLRRLAAMLSEADLRQTMQSAHADALDAHLSEGAARRCT